MPNHVAEVHSLAPMTACDKDYPDLAGPYPPTAVFAGRQKLAQSLDVINIIYDQQPRGAGIL